MFAAIAFAAALMTVPQAWVVSRVADEMTDEVTVSATVRSGQESLAVVCGPGRAFHVLRVSEFYLGRTTTPGPAYRVDSLSPAPHGWRQAGNRAVVEHDNAARMTFQMMSGRTVLTRLSLADGGAIDRPFPISGSTAAILDVRRACGIPDFAGS
jgi:hypothetical protein